VTAFRILDQNPVYRGPDDLPAVGGYLAFYESDSTTPKDVYADPGLTINNGATVEIGTDGRTVVDVWGDGKYRVRLYAANDTLIAEADDVEIPGGAAAAIPIPEEGEFLTGDGTQFLVQTLLLLPDPIGQDGKVVTANGAGYILTTLPSAPVIPDPEIVVTETSGTLTSFQAGVSDDTDKFFAQYGSGSAPASGANTTTLAVVFPVAFDATPFVFITPTVAAAGSGGFLPVSSLISQSATGFTVKFDTNGSDAPNSRITNPITFIWKAEGVRTVEPEE
jgi:hypothetical protein